MASDGEVDYHEEGVKLLARLNLDGVSLLPGIGRYDPLNQIYKHAGGGELKSGVWCVVHPLLKEFGWQNEGHGGQALSVHCTFVHTRVLPRTPHFG